MTPSSPQVTVVIPVWDGYVETMQPALASVAGQGIQYQLILVDNASAAPVPAVADSVTVSLPDRRSTGAARNAALERVETPYVVFLDADDELLPGALLALKEGIERTGATAYCLSILDGETGRRHRTPRLAARWLASSPRLFALFEAVWSLLPTQGCTIMRTEDVRVCGGYGDSDHGEDWALGVSLAFRGRICFDRRLGLRYRHHGGSPGVVALSPELLSANARRVRERIQADPATPRWVKATVGLLAIAQWLAARVAHPGYRALRAIRSGPPPAGAQARQDGPH